jgi:hypothetical protein
MKISQMFTLLGNKQTAITTASAGDIIGLSKLDNVITGHTLCDKANPITYPRAKYPTSVYYRAIAAKVSKDEEKLYSSLTKLQIEDPCLDVHRNNETKQLSDGWLKRFAPQLGFGARQKYLQHSSRCCRPENSHIAKRSNAKPTAGRTISNIRRQRFLWRRRDAHSGRVAAMPCL